MEKLVAISEQNIMYDEELSFCKIPRSYKRIPIECREPMPRYCNEETKRKLHAKRQAMLDIGDILREKGFFGGLSRKEFKKGSREFFRQTDIYWANHRMLFKKEEETILQIEAVKE